MAGVVPVWWQSAVFPRGDKTTSQSPLQTRQRSLLINTVTACTILLLLCAWDSTERQVPAQPSQSHHWRASLWWSTIKTAHPLPPYGRVACTARLNQLNPPCPSVGASCHWRLCMRHSHMNAAHAPQDYPRDKPTRTQAFNVLQPCNLSQGMNDKIIKPHIALVCLRKEWGNNPSGCESDFIQWMARATKSKKRCTWQPRQVQISLTTCKYQAQESIHSPQSQVKTRQVQLTAPLQFRDVTPHQWLDSHQSQITGTEDKRKAQVPPKTTPEHS